MSIRLLKTAYQREILLRGLGSSLVPHLRRAMVPWKGLIERVHAHRARGERGGKLRWEGCRSQTTSPDLDGTVQQEKAASWKTVLRRGTGLRFSSLRDLSES